MSAYAVVAMDVLDPEGLKEYRARVQATVAAYEGRFLVRGGRSEMLEGDWRPDQLVVIEFPDWDRARRWYDSPEYQEISLIRKRSSRADLFAIVEGV